MWTFTDSRMGLSNEPVNKVDRTNRSELSGGSYEHEQ